MRGGDARRRCEAAAFRRRPGREHFLIEAAPAGRPASAPVSISPRPGEFRPLPGEFRPLPGTVRAAFSTAHHRNGDVLELVGGRLMPADFCLSADLATPGVPVVMVRGEVDFETAPGLGD